MKEEFVSFDLAKKLKEKGYPQKNCFRCYFVGDDKVRGCSVGDVIHRSYKGEKHLIAAPTISQVLKWLREEKNIVVSMYPYYSTHVKEHWCWDVRTPVNRVQISSDVRQEGFDSYEEAALAGISYTLDDLI